MKILLIGTLFLLRLTAWAQSSIHSSLNTAINDDDKTYSIRIDGDRNGKEIHYNRTFSAVGLSSDQKEALKNRVLDSLGLGETPPSPHTPTASEKSALVRVTFVCPTCTGKTRLTISGNNFSAEHTIDIDRDKSAYPFDLDMPPGEYRYTYWQNKVEQMQLPFTVKAGQETTVRVK